MSIISFTDLQVYQRANKLYPKIVKVSAGFSRQSLHLRDQICRAANSVQSNIAEGFGRSTPEFKKYLTSSLGSCNKLNAHLSNALSIGEIDKINFDNLLSEINIIGKQIYVLRKNWR